MSHVITYCVIAFILGLFLPIIFRKRWFQDVLGFFYVYGMLAIQVTFHFFKTGRSLRKDIKKSDDYWNAKCKKDDEDRKNGTYVEKTSKQIHEEYEAHMKMKI